jgi:hypothetical protein
MPAVTLNSSTNSTIPNIWSNSSTGSLSYGRFFGLANQGWGVYNSTGGLPSPLNTSREFKTGSLLGFAVGAGYSGTLRTGIDLSLQGTAGSAALGLNDKITFDWTKDDSNFYLTSSYGYSPSTLSVTGPSASATITGRFDIDGDAYVLADTPFSNWSKIWKRSIFNGNPLFSRTFSSTGTADVSLLGGAASLSYQGVNLSTTSAQNTQLTNGVRSTIVDPVLRASLDLDRSIGTFLGLPNGLTFGASASLGPLSASASLTLADALLNYQASISQSISATVDNITGLLTLEGGQKLPYTVGNRVTLPRSVYDVNRDGKLDVSGVFTKNGTVTNRTDIVNDVSARLTALSGSVKGKFNYFFGSKTVKSGFGPLYDSGDYRLAGNTFNAYNNSWATQLGQTPQLSLSLT